MTTNGADADTADADRADADYGDADYGEAIEDDADRYDADRSDADRSDADESDADESDADESNADESNADESDADESDADESDADESDADRSDTDGELDDDLAVAVVTSLTARGATVAVAESLTGGLVCAALTDVPGASAAVRGGIVAYATDLKAELLGVSPVLLRSAGPVHPVVAATMASAVRDRLGATYGLSTTGVAGPETQDDQAVGTVYIAVDGPDGSSVERHQLGGDRADIRDESVGAALRLLLAELAPSEAMPDRRR